MPVTVYKSTDASAPVLTGLAGSLITVLDAVLVNGYGSKAAAGWTKPYTGTNLAAYRTQTTGTGIGTYLRIDDASPNSTAAGREAQARGHEAMTAISTGTGPYPTTTQMAVSGAPIRKSATADSTARPWVAVADSRTLYLFTQSSDFTGYSGFSFGEFYSLKGSDSYRSYLIGRSVVNTALDNDDRLDDLVLNTSTTPNVGVVLSGHWMPRHYPGEIQSAITFGKHSDGIKGASPLRGVMGNGSVVYPNPADASLMLGQVWIHEDHGEQIVIRGRLRGFWDFLHPPTAAVNDGDTFSGTGPLAGKTFLVIKPIADSLGGLYVIETSDTWETN